MSSKRADGRKTRRQVDALKAQRNLRDRLRVWREGRREAADERERQRRKAEPARSRGKDRVPVQLRVATPEPVTVVVHEHPNYRWRRNRALLYGSPLATGKNRPYVNLDKDRSRAGKARRNRRQVSR